jgi:hypothetical protein
VHLGAAGDHRQRGCHVLRLAVGLRRGRERAGVDLAGEAGRDLIFGGQVVGGHPQQLARGKADRLPGVADALHDRASGGLIFLRERMGDAVIAGYPCRHV